MGPVRHYNLYNSYGPRHCLPRLQSCTKLQMEGNQSKVSVGDIYWESTWHFSLIGESHSRKDKRQKCAARPPPAYSWPLSHLWIICTLKRWLHHRQPLSLEEIIIFVNHTLQMVAPPPAKTRECAFLENLLLYAPILTCSDWKCVLPDLNSDCKVCRWIVLLLPN